ncbi:MAG: hypothetical protein ABJH04_12700 [Cyclobacteriaceae bacterium]
MQRTVYIIFLVLILFTFSVYAQPGDPSSDPDVPITGIEILLSAGALLGLKKLMGKSKQK